jgi:hypothetical protein
MVAVPEPEGPYRFIMKAPITKVGVCEVETCQLKIKGHIDARGGVFSLLDFSTLVNAPFLRFGHR